MRFQDIPQFTRSGSWDCRFRFDQLIKWINDETKEGLELNPDFQRGHVWTEEQQVAFMEYVLRGGKSGRTLYFNNPEWHRKGNGSYKDYVCVDGLQRITAIKRFIYDEIKVFGSYYSEYEDKLRMTEEHSMVVSVNDLKTKAEVLNWYIEMNSGGTPHTDDEIERVRKMMTE